MVPILDEDVGLYLQSEPNFPIHISDMKQEKVVWIKVSDMERSISINDGNVLARILGLRELIFMQEHSSAIALREHLSPEQIKQGTMHQTNKAFERYSRVGADDVRNIYKKSQKIEVEKRRND